MKMGLLCGLLLSVACGGSASAPVAGEDLAGHYDVTIVTSPTALFGIESTTKGTLDLVDAGGRITGSWSWGQSAWNDPRCVSVTPPADCAPDQTAEDGRSGIVFAGAVDERGCVQLELRTAAYPGFMSRETWLGSVTKDGLDFHSAGACQESVEGFAMGGTAQAWAVKH